MLVSSLLLGLVSTSAPSFGSSVRVLKHVHRGPDRGAEESVVAVDLAQHTATRSDNRCGFVEGDVPRDTRLWDGLGGDGDKILRDIVGYMARNVTYGSTVGGIQGFTKGMIGDVAGTLAGMVNPLLGLTVSIIRGFFSPADQYQQLVKSILEHVGKMIEAAIDAQVVETIKQELIKVSGNMACAIDSSEWSAIVNDQGATATVFSNACTSDADSSACKSYQSRNGGQKVLMEMFWVDLLASTWLEARRNNWTRWAGRTSVRFNASVAILDKHWSRYLPWRASSSRFISGVEPWYEEGETCYTAGRDNVTGNLLISANCPGRARSGSPPSAFLDYTGAKSIFFCADGRQDWATRVANCRNDYIKTVRSDLSRLAAHLADIRRLNTVMQQVQR